VGHREITMERRKRIALVAHDNKPLQRGNAPALVVAAPSSTRPALMTKIPRTYVVPPISTLPSHRPISA
jgi:hypothetical protein